MNGSGTAGSPSWYALRTRSRHEKKVREQLLLQQFETFLPLVDRWSRWKDRRQLVQFPLFPGYCFVRFSPGERVRVLNVRGVVDVVGVNGHPEPLPEHEIASIRRLLASRFRFDPHPFLEEGMEVEIVRGPLAGVRGRLVRKDHVARLVIGVVLIHQAVAVNVHAADVAPV